MCKTFKPPEHVNSLQSTTNVFMQDYCNIRNYFTGSFSLGIAKFDTLSNQLLTIDIIAYAYNHNVSG